MSNKVSNNFKKNCLIVLFLALAISFFANPFLAEAQESEKKLALAGTSIILGTIVTGYIVDALIDDPIEAAPGVAVDIPLVRLQRDLEIDFPELFGEDVHPEAGLPGFVKYIFNFSIIIGGLIVFGAIVAGGICYLTSAGNPTALLNARNQISSGLIGLAVLLGSWLVLTTLDPHLIIVKPGVLPVGVGVRLYGDGSHTSQTFMESQENFGGFKPTDFVFLSPPANLLVYVYKGENFTGTNKRLEEARGKKASLPFIPKSISIEWLLPGAYLCIGSPLIPGAKCLHVSESRDLPVKYDNKVDHIKIMHPPGVHGYMVFLHDKKGQKGTTEWYYSYEKDLPAEPILTLATQIGGIGARVVPGNPIGLAGKVSSVTIFVVGDIGLDKGSMKEKYGKGVFFYEWKNYNGICIEEVPNKIVSQNKILTGEWVRWGKNLDCHRWSPGLFTGFLRGPGGVLFIEFEGELPRARSLRIDGSYIALVCNNEGSCEVFKGMDALLRDNYIARRCMGTLNPYNRCINVETLFVTPVPH